MVVRWWEELALQLQKQLQEEALVGPNTFIAKDAKLNGLVSIGANCMIGTGVILRGRVRIEDNVRIGYGVEIKDSLIKANTTIGPLCYIGNSLIEESCYFGALVRTSNHRLDQAEISSWNGELLEPTGQEKLGAWVQKRTALGVGVVILPGRIVPPESEFSPHLVITKNYSTGIYRLAQAIQKVI